MGENGVFCKVCGKWCNEQPHEWVYATYRGERVKVCYDCKRAIELKE